MTPARQIEHAIKKMSNQTRAKTNARFFKTEKGAYGEGDVFLGVTMPAIRMVVRQYGEYVTLGDARALLGSRMHEVRMAGTLALVHLMAHAKSKTESRTIYKAYLAHIGKGINNWDLIDVSAPQVVGASTYHAGDLAVLEALCSHKNMWKRRVGIVATFYWLKQKDPSATLACAALLLTDQEDLLHKATGWMLREMGKKCGMQTLRGFLKTNASKMPRTMLRYAIEKMGASERKKWMAIPPAN